MISSDSHTTFKGSIVQFMLPLSLGAKLGNVGTALYNQGHSSYGEKKELASSCNPKPLAAAQLC